MLHTLCLVKALVGQFHQPMPGKSLSSLCLCRHPDLAGLPALLVVSEAVLLGHPQQKATLGPSDLVRTHLGVTVSWDVPPASLSSHEVVWVVFSSTGLPCLGGRIPGASLSALPPATIPPGGVHGLLPLHCQLQLFIVGRSVKLTFWWVRSQMNTEEGSAD